LIPIDEIEPFGTSDDCRGYDLVMSENPMQWPAETEKELTPAELYLDLLKKCLTRFIFDRSTGFDPQLRAEGIDWPAEGETMMGLRRLQNLQDCITDVLRKGVMGDLIEAGVWRGGGTIFMRGVLKAFGDRERTVWVADSFAGLPPPSPDLYPADEGASFHLHNNVLGVPVEEVKANFARYGLLDDRVRFLEGWFKDTLPGAPISRLAVLRLDGDMYESTIIGLRSLYSKVSVGGYVIIDDYAPTLPGCVQAVHDFRAENNITEEMTSTGHYGVFWQRLR
jgi:hypothetical protein